MRFEWIDMIWRRRIIVDHHDHDQDNNDDHAYDNDLDHDKEYVYDNDKNDDHENYHDHNHNHDLNHDHKLDPAITMMETMTYMG